MTGEPVCWLLSNNKLKKKTASKERMVPEIKFSSEPSYQLLRSVHYASFSAMFSSLYSATNKGEAPL